MKKTLTLIVAILFVNISIRAQSWAKVVIGPSPKEINVVAVSPSGNLYIAGSFWPLGGSVTEVWMRSGSTWVQVGSGIPSASAAAPEILSMCIDASGNIYATGEFNDAAGNSYVAKWDGTTWSHLGPVGGSLSLGSTAVCTDSSGNVYAAGRIAGDTVNNVYKWNGTSWVELGTGPTALNANGSINTICAGPGGALYAGGLFHIGPLGSSQCVAKWNGSSWSPLGTATCPPNPYGITSIITDSAGNVYATHVLADPVLSDSTGWPVCKWDGTAWSILGTGAGALRSNRPVLSLCKDHSGNIYAAGEFGDSAFVYGFNYCYVAKWNGSSWNELGTGSGRLHPHDRIWTICSDNSGKIYASGNITDDAGNGIVGEYGYFPAGFTAPNYSVEVVISPNPAHDYINVNIRSASNINVGTGYHLYDCLGRSYRSGKIEDTNTAINISQFPVGTYLLQLGNDLHTYKIIKE